MRDYGVPPSVWDGDPECEHVWGDELPPKPGAGNKKITGKEQSYLKSNAQFGQNHPEPGRFCQLCGAWYGCLGLEPTPELYVKHLVDIFRKLRRVLRDDGVLFLNLGDSYFGSWGNYGDAGGGQRAKETERFDRKSYNDKTRWRPPTSFNHSSLKPKDLVGIPWMVAFALRNDGWWLRNDIIWSKKNGMPESAGDRCTKAHEYVFLLTKSKKYFFDQEAIKEPSGEAGKIVSLGEKSFSKGQAKGRNVKPSGNGLSDTYEVPPTRNKRSVWDIAEERDPLLAYLLMSLAADQPDLLEKYVDQYTSDMSEKTTIWSLATQPYSGPHYAVMPMSLVEPCILAGCPHKVCAECGAPWVRVVEKEKGEPDSFNGSSFNTGKTYKAQSNLAEVGQPERTIQTKTLGFEPTCTCNASTIPGTVLDPFVGSGTVPKVAIMHNRNWLGVDLDTSLIDDRINGTQRQLL